ncbi:MAG TPA: hypothetical protein VEH30_11570 [Terriglobales bacterium]|nr:hypothetical protein [Terriglobales bacterium]
MSDHSKYEELAALYAGGHLTHQEQEELNEHLRLCPDCRNAEREFEDLVRSGLPLARSTFLEFVDSLKDRPDAGALERFVARARGEGIRFSGNVEKTRSQGWLRPGFLPAGATVFAVVMIAAAAAYEAYISHSAVFRERVQAQQQVSRLDEEISNLNARLAQEQGERAAQQHELQQLRGLLGRAANSVQSYRRDNEQTGVRLEQSTSQVAQLADELQNREKQLIGAQEEIAQINQLKATDEASLVAQQIRIKEISDQLRIANATLDMERQLAAAGRDIRELLVARQLHVVDVRDTDANGKPKEAFGRVFLTEGKSLMFYAFDLNDGKGTDAKASFQVWGEQLGKQSSTRRLGILYADDKAQKRWALKIDNSDLLSEIDAVFVTVSTGGGNNKLNGQRLLYAYLGQPNHN